MVQDLNAKLHKHIEFSKDGVDASAIVELERENIEIRKESAGLKKIWEPVTSTLNENKSLKEAITRAQKGIIS